MNRKKISALLEIFGLIFFFTYSYYQLFTVYGVFFYIIPILCFTLAASLNDYKIGWWVMGVTLITSIITFIIIIIIF